MVGGAAMTRNYGRFKITNNSIMDNPQAVIDAFIQLRLLVVRAEFLFEDDAIEYMAYCTLFSPVPEGMIIPEYVIKITTENGRFVLAEAAAL
jgi:hypothetical protein